METTKISTETLIKGRCYDMEDVYAHFIGWMVDGKSYRAGYDEREALESGFDSNGYDLGAFFENGIYLGPDNANVEPRFF